MIKKEKPIPLYKKGRFTGNLIKSPLGKIQVETPDGDIKEIFLNRKMRRTLIRAERRRVRRELRNAVKKTPQYEGIETDTEGEMC